MKEYWAVGPGEKASLRYTPDEDEKFQALKPFTLSEKVASSVPLDLN